MVAYLEDDDGGVLAGDRVSHLPAMQVGVVVWNINHLARDKDDGPRAVTAKAAKAAAAFDPAGIDREAALAAVSAALRAVADLLPTVEGQIDEINALLPPPKQAKGKAADEVDDESSEDEGLEDEPTKPKPKPVAKPGVAPEWLAPHYEPNAAVYKPMRAARSDLRQLGTNIRRLTATGLVHAVDSHIEALAASGGDDLESKARMLAVLRDLNQDWKRIKQARAMLDVPRANLGELKKASRAQLRGLKRARKVVAQAGAALDVHRHRLPLRLPAPAAGPATAVGAGRAGGAAL